MYNRPILVESIGEGKERKVFITGNAIDVGISKNNVEYTEPVLRAAAKTLIGKPLLLNHEYMDVRNIMGKIIAAEFDGKNVPFKAEIDTEEKDILRKLEKGFINKVSIGADTIKDGKSYDPEPDDDGIIRPEGIRFEELSLVTIAGVPNATISQVIAESFKVKKMEEKKIEQLEEELKKTKEENESLRQKLAEEEGEEKPAEQEEPAPEKTDEPEPEKKDEEEEKEKKEEKEKVEALSKKMEKLTASVSKLTEQPKGVADESKKKEAFGYQIITEAGKGGKGVDIYSPDCIKENTNPESRRKWALY